MLTRLKALLRSMALIALLIVLVPVWVVHRFVSLVRVSLRAGSSRQIERVSAASIDLNEVLERGVPVIIQGLVDELHLTTIPNLEGLRGIAAVQKASFRVKSHKSHSPYFLYTGDYGTELDHVDEMTLDEFLAFMFDRERDPQTCVYRLFGVADLDGTVGEIVDDMSRGLEKLVRRAPDRNASGIWIGSKGVVTPLHHDAWTGLLFQMTGSKRVLMFSPVERPNLYFRSPFAARDRWSSLPGRADDADPSRFPRFYRATRYEAQLDAGEVLFIPPFWSHEVEALEANISIPFRFHVRALDHLNPGFLRPGFEIFHHKFLENRVAK